MLHGRTQGLRWAKSSLSYSNGVCVEVAGLLLAAYLSAHRIMITGSALCAALAITERG